MGKIHDVQKLTDNRFVNLYHVDATSVHNTPVSYYVASRAKDIPSLKMKTGRNDPDGVIIYSVYGEKKDKVVLIRQYRYALGGYIYEFPAGLVEQNEDFQPGFHDHRAAGSRYSRHEPAQPDGYERYRCRSL